MQYSVFLAFIINGLLVIESLCAGPGHFLCRKYLEKEYCAATGKVLGATEIFDLARLALGKEKDTVKVNEKPSLQEESMALRVVEREWDAVVSHIIRKIRIHRRALGCRLQSPTKVILGGGIIDYNQDMLKAILKKKGFLRDIQFVFSTLGDRRAILGAVAYAKSICESTLASENCYAIGIDLGGTHIRVALVNVEHMQIVGDILKQKLFQGLPYGETMAGFSECMLKGKSVASFSKTDQGKHAVLANVVLTNITNLVKKAAMGKEIAFIAMSSAGDIDDEGYCKRATFLPFSGVHVRAELEARTKLPVIIAHDIFCGALGEKIVGAGMTDKKFIFVALGTFIGVQLFDSDTWDCRNL